VNHSRTYENYPAWTVLASNLVSWSIYVIGTYILGRVWIGLVIPYLAYVAWLEVRLLRTACVDCAYYDRVCAFGRGKLCALAFERGDPRRFASREASWKDVLPDLLVPILPLLGGVLLLVLRGWSWVIGGLVLVLVLLASVGTGFVRGTLACSHCEQRLLGCPASALFAGRSDD
jgi:hypothetical protein